MENHAAVVAAAQSGDLQTLDRLLAEDPAAASARDGAGVSAIMHALYRRQNAALEKLLSARPQLDIFEAAGAGNVDSLTELVRQDQTLAKAFSPDGFTALHLAAFFSQPAAAGLLLDHGADPDAVARNPMKVRPLHSAAASRSVPVAKLLLKHGASVDARQHGGWTALHAAAQQGDLSMAELLRSFGANKSLANDDGVTAVQLAGKGGYEDIVELLSA